MLCSYVQHRSTDVSLSRTFLGTVITDNTYTDIQHNDMRLLERSTWTDRGVGRVKREFYERTVQRRHLDVGCVKRHRHDVNSDTIQR